MTGVDHFRSVTQAEESQKKAGQRVAKINQCFIPAIVLTVILLILVKFGNPERKVLEALSVLASIANLGLLLYSEALFVIFKMIFLPFRALKDYGTIGLIIAFFIWLIYLPICLYSYIMAPIVPLLYEKYLCGIALECAKDFAG